MMQASRHFSLLIGLISIIVVSAAFFLVPSKSAADIQIDKNVSTQGRALTPAGKLVGDRETNLPAVGSLTVNFVRSPDKIGTDGKGRYLIAVNGGFGMQFSATSRPQQSVSVIDLNAVPAPIVIQNIYFPSPAGANFGAAFTNEAEPDGSYRLYVAGGFDNKIRVFGFSPNNDQPLTPANKPDEPLNAPFIDVSAFTENAPSPDYNNNTAPVYPLGIALAPDNESIYVANNLGDTLGIVSDLRESRRLTRIALQRPGSTQFVYPYDVKLLTSDTDAKNVSKVYISLWGDGTIAVVDPKTAKVVRHITVDRHPTKMILNAAQNRLFVVNSDGDSVSVIETKTDRVVEKINVQLAENAPGGVSPEGLALSEDEKTLYVANAHANAVGVVSLSTSAQGIRQFTQFTGLRRDIKIVPTESKIQNPKSKIVGFIPTGNYASAVAVVGSQIFIANGKGTGVENSSVIPNNSGRAPNMPNEKFPASTSKRGAYNPALVIGNISLVAIPGEKQLFDYTQAAMRNNGLLGDKKTGIFAGGRSPFKHVIYIIRENRTYDQVFGDLQTAGDGSKADGEPSVAIFGAGEIAKSPSGTAQNVTPNARALALRFGLMDRFFVNAEASPDGHNWSTAAFSNDYIDKTFRWNYSGRGRTYDFEGFNRLPSYDPPFNQPPVSLPSVFRLPATENDVANFLKKYIPYLHGNRDVGEPETLYLWDAANKAGLSYRAYGEFVATVSAEDVREVNTRKPKIYPDLSPTLTAFATKKSLENHFSSDVRNFDQNTPDSMTTESYRLVRQENGKNDPAITRNNNRKEFQGNSRFGEWQHEFRSFVADLQAGKGDKLPNLSILRFSNDHTAGLRASVPTPQFYVAENDYALGRLVEEVSNSPYWKDTAIFVVEDDAQDGPDHVDAHRSPALVISAYNKQGALVHDFHNTVSLIRTLEICLGMPPMNFLDANAMPIDVFTNVPDFTPYHAVLPEITLDNLMPPPKPSAAMLRYMEMTNEQNLSHADMANARQLNEIIWYSVRGENISYPKIARLPAFDLMTAGIQNEKDENQSHEYDSEE
ncbi:MAG: alkaline phosphatase family protein [Pyrinomonadaceae bacterium]